MSGPVIATDAIRQEINGTEYVFAPTPGGLAWVLLDGCTGRPLSGAHTTWAACWRDYATTRHTALLLDDPQLAVGTGSPLIGQDEFAASALLAVDERAEVMVRWSSLELALAFAVALKTEVEHAMQVAAEVGR